MRLYAYESNDNFRNIRKKQFNLHSQQKLAFRELLRHQPAPDFTHPDLYPTLTHGVPSEFRALVWNSLIANPYNITSLFYTTVLQHLHQHELLYHERQQKQAENQRAILQRASIETISPEDLKAHSKDPIDQESRPDKISVALQRIQKDLPRTFPELKNLHEDPEEYKRLTRILGAVAIMREDIGYIQGMSQIATLLLFELNDEFEAFSGLMTLLSTNPLNDFFTFNEPNIQVFSNRVSQRIRKLSPEICDLLAANEVDIKMMVINWVMTLFSRCFQLDSILNIWDILLANQLVSPILQELCAAIAVARKGALFACKDPGKMVKLLLHSKLDLMEEEWVLQYLRSLPRCC